MATAAAADDVIRFPDGSKVISWLPAAHIAERNAHHYLPIVFGMTVTTCPNPREIVAYLPAVKPTWFFAVPRIFEKLKAGLEGHLSTQGEQTVGWLTAARRKVELEQAGEPVPEDVAATAAEGDAQLFSGLRAMLGLDEALAVNAGAAPTPRDVLVFFHAIGIPLAELWGMSETCGVGAVNPIGRVRIGTVGPPSLGRRAQAGRRRRAARARRRRDDRLPQPARQDRGGDRRRRLAAHGRHRGVRRRGLRPDRRPQEGDHHQRGRQEHVPGQHRVDAQGRRPDHRPGLRDRRRAARSTRRWSCSTPTSAPRSRRSWGSRARGSTSSRPSRRSSAPCRRRSTRATQELARVEQIKKFTIIPGDWLPGGDELTPTMKLKRKPIAAKYAAEIEAHVR